MITPHSVDTIKTVQKALKDATNGALGLLRDQGFQVRSVSVDIGTKVAPNGSKTDYVRSVNLTLEDRDSGITLKV